MMLFQALLTVLLQSSFSTVISSPISPRGQCITAYVASSSRVGLDLFYLQELSKSFLEKEHSNSLPTRSKVVLDVGLASMSRSEVFEHMMQLNISGVDHSERLSLNCRSNELSISPRDLFSLPQSEFIYVQGSRIQAYFPALNWVSLLQLYPESKVLMNDMTDEEYLSNQFKDSCTGKSSKPLYCYVPLVPLKGRKSLSPDDKFLLSKFSPAKLSQILHAYREVIKCLVPEGQLFRFNLRHISSADYWTGLTHLLGLNYSTTATAGGGSSSRTVFYLDHLIAGGLKAEIKPRQVCVPSAIGKDTVCTGKKDLLEVSPSVCDDTLLPATIAKRLTQCATRYAETMDSILSGGGRYRTLLLDQMLYSSPNTLRRAPIDSSRLIMNVAPGTTGTTSLFLTMSMLNITGRHFAQYRVNCTSTTLRGALIDWDMKILSLPQYGTSSISGSSVSDNDGVDDNRGSVFWADTPVSERWWQVFRMYPHSKIMMTDVRDDAVWIRKRRKEHCGSINTRAGCTMPIPIDFHRIYNTSETANAFYNAVHVSRVKSDQGVRMFAAFRSLIRCAVPPEQQMWIYFSEQNDSAVFWNSLISFTNVSIKHSTRQVLINAGIPKSSQHTSCSVGNEPCEFVARGNDSAIIPSVCAPSKKYAN